MTMQTVSRQQAKDLIDQHEDLVVIETLDEKYYRKFHLPGAHNVPLDDSFEDRVAELTADKSTPILLYCMDTECEASSKAATQLEDLGYSEIYDYEAGKVDWKEGGLPIENESKASA